MIDLQAEAREIVGRYPEGKQRAALLPLLHRAQERDGYVTSGAIEEIGGLLGLAPAEVRGVASFYSMLHLEPKGRHVISVCHNLACTMAGAENLVAELERRLGVQAGSTTPDGEFTLERAECLAACDLAPMIQLDYDRMMGPLSGEQAVTIVDKLLGSTPERAGSAIDEIRIAPRQFERAERVRMPSEVGSGAEPAPLIDSILLSDEDRLLLHPEIVRRVHEPAPEPAEEENRESGADGSVPKSESDPGDDRDA